MEIEVLLKLIELILTQKDEVGDFVEKLANKNFVTDKGDLLVATKMRQIELVRFVLRSGVKPTLESFQYAAEHEFFELCRLFVEFGSREILSTPNLEYQLKSAIGFNEQEKVVELINRGVNFTVNNNFTINLILLKNNIEVARLLFKHGADFKAVYNDTMYLASVRGYTEIVRLFLDYGTPPYIYELFPRIIHGSSFFELLDEYEANL
jgi:hypothetical protein